MQLRFGAFALDLGTRQLMRDDSSVHLTPKAFDLLAILIEERPNVVSKAALLKRLWPETFVEEANVSNLVGEIRSALDDRPQCSRWIRTAHGYGYAFCGEATTSGAASRARLDPPRCWLEWGEQRFPLGPGEHVVGRDVDVAIRLDSPTVSRRHARLVVTPAGTSLEDFGSKNGTHRGASRVVSPVQLADGDSIHFGNVLVTFHTRATATTTRTHQSTRLRHSQEP